MEGRTAIKNAGSEKREHVVYQNESKRDKGQRSFGMGMTA